jgi:hypothetical protein
MTRRCIRWCSYPHLLKDGAQALSDAGRVEVLETFDTGSQPYFGGLGLSSHSQARTRRRENLRGDREEAGWETDLKRAEGKESCGILEVAAHQQAPSSTKMEKS